MEQGRLIILSDDKRREIVEFIVPLRWHFKNRGVKKSDIRVKIAERFRASAKYISGEWTTDEFCMAWDWLLMQNTNITRSTKKAVAK